MSQTLLATTRFYLSRHRWSSPATQRTILHFHIKFHFCFRFNFHFLISINFSIYILSLDFSYPGTAPGGLTRVR